MVKLFIQSRRSTRNSSEGIALVELLVAIVVAFIIFGLSLGLIVSQRKIFVEDRDRMQTNQTLRAGMDLVGNDIKQAGERLVGTQLPVVQIINGGSATTPDQLVLQRNIIDQVLPVCATITAGTSQNTVDVAVKGASGSCTFSDSDATPGPDPDGGLPDNLVQWRNARCGQDGNTACARTTNVSSNTSCLQNGGTDPECMWAYIYDPTHNRGEFFLYSFEGPRDIPDTTTNRYRVYRADGGTWQYTYTYNAANPNSTPLLYILEERRYQLVTNPKNSNDKILQLILNQQTTAPINLVNQLTNFKVTALMQNGAASKSSFNSSTPYSDNWQQIQAIQIDLTATNPVQGATKVPNLVASAQYFPRNIMSTK